MLCSFCLSSEDIWMYKKYAWLPMFEFMKNMLGEDRFLPFILLFYISSGIILVFIYTCLNVYRPNDLRTDIVQFSVIITRAANLTPQTKFILYFIQLIGDEHEAGQRSTWCSIYYAVKMTLNSRYQGKNASEWVFCLIFISVFILIAEVRMWWWFYSSKNKLLLSYFRHNTVCFVIVSILPTTIFPVKPVQYWATHSGV